VIGSIFLCFLGLPLLAQSNTPAFMDPHTSTELVRFLSVGPSMEPTMPACRKETFVDPSIELAVGAIAAFSCTSETCNRQNGKKRSYVKRVAKIEEKEGKTCYAMHGDNQSNSFDSNDYGTVCEGDDIEVYGTVVGWNGCQA